MNHGPTLGAKTIILHPALQQFNEIVRPSRPENSKISIPNAVRICRAEIKLLEITDVGAEVEHLADLKSLRKYLELVELEQMLSGWVFGEGEKLGNRDTARDIEMRVGSRSEDTEEKLEIFDDGTPAAEMQERLNGRASSGIERFVYMARDTSLEKRRCDIQKASKGFHNTALTEQTSSGREFGEARRFSEIPRDITRIMRVESPEGGENTNEALKDFDDTIPVWSRWWMPWGWESCTPMILGNFGRLGDLGIGAWDRT